MPDRTDHVVLDLKTSELHCKHCGDRYRMALPCNLSVLIGASEAYRRVHRHCRPAEVAHA